MDQVPKLHKLLKYLFQWRRGRKRFNLSLNWEELRENCQKICLKEISFKDLMEITKGWNPNKKFRLLDEREANIRENQANIQYIEEKWNKKDHTVTPSGFQGVLNQPNPSMASHHSETNKSVAKSYHSQKSQ
ncbi:hypothetical protein O181_001211 [Austropuccinia psidii MF-1]|uniref:Uncharacterized protein n=1 Tax=Austropuccinia psidii MF-1 TaxID=1389203 RepID=A0A9Q3BAJ7_9BASI|nr:hypothetical protein [Austropuccinia psidii MF-1]